ncbi:hypothetical protein BGZ72_000965 [Mortierella alpina]|nr:hypothetical protein BGZ72_000965 [Mortierella alpina]
MILQCTRTRAATRLASGVRLPAASRARIHSANETRAAAAAASASSSSSSIPDDIDTPLPSSGLNSNKDARRAISFETQKRKLLTSMDMLYQIQDAPSERSDTTPLDDQEAQYWARRMNAAITDLEQEHTRLRVAVIGETSGQDSIMDLLLPSEQNVRRSAKETGKVHRVRYGSQYELLEDGVENVERTPISWLEGMTEMDGGEIVETPGVDLDDLTMDDIVYNSDLILLRTDAQRQLSLEQEQRFLNRYRHKSHILVVADMSGSDSSSEALTVANIKANLAHAVRSSTQGYSNIQSSDSTVTKVLRISNPEPIPAVMALSTPSRSSSKAQQDQYLENVGTLQKLVASTLMGEGSAQQGKQHRQIALLTRCRELMTSGIENMESRLNGRLETFAQVDRLSELATQEIKRIAAQEQERMVAQVTDGEVDKDVRQMRNILDHFFKSEVPFWMLFARSGEIAERMHEQWSAGAFAETEHRMAYALGRLHQSSQEAFRATLKAMDTLAEKMEQNKPIGSTAVLKDLASARQLLSHAQDDTQQAIKDKDAFVVSNIVWKHRNAYGTPAMERTLEAGRPGALERLQRRGQVTLAQGLGLQGTALFTGLGLAQQFPPEIYLTSGSLLALAGLGYMQVRWKAAENEFKAEANALAEQLKQDIVSTYQEQVNKTIVKPLSSVVQTLDKNLGDRLLRSLEQRKVLTGIKREAKGEEEIKF